MVGCRGQLVRYLWTMVLDMAQFLASQAASLRSVW
jgi:hypothetical protein